MGITNAEAAHLGLSDFSDGPDLREDPAAFAAAVATINRERQERHEQAIAQYLVDRERYEQYLRDKAAYEESLAQGQGALAEPEPFAPPDDGVDPFNPREWESGPASVTAPIAPPDDGVDPFNPREWEYTPEPEAFSTIVAEDSPKEIESVDPFDLDVFQPAPTPDPDEAFSTITHEPDPGRDFNLVEAITAPDEGGEYDYHQTPAGLIVAQEPEQPRDDTGRFIPSEPTESDNAPAVFSTIVAEDPGAPDEGGEYDYFQTPAGLTVAKLQPGDHLLEEAEAKTFYPHPTPGQTGDALVFESDGARSELVPENPADYLLKEAPPALWTPGGETVHDNDYLLGESDGRRSPPAESWPTWLPRGHGSYMGHGERRGAGQSHGDGDGGVLDALTGGAAWMQGDWDRRVVDPIKRRWPVEDAPENSYSPAQAGQLAAFMPGYGIGLESTYMTMSPTERRDFAADLMRETPVISGLAAADTSEGWEKALHLGGAAIELPWLYGPGRGAGMAMRSAGRMAKNAPAHLPVYGVGGGSVARPAKVAKPAFDDFLSDFGKRQPAQDFINDVQADFTATWRRGYGYGDEFDDLGHFEGLRAGEDLARSAREASAAYDARVASGLARIRAINAGRAGGWAWDPTGLLVPSLAAKSLSASAPATAQGPAAAPLTTNGTITAIEEAGAEILADVKVTPPPDAPLTANETITAIEEAGAGILADAAPKVKTTGEPSVNLFEEATKEFTDRLATKTKAAPLDEVGRSGRARRGSGGRAVGLLRARARHGPQAHGRRRSGASGLHFVRSGSEDPHDRHRAEGQDHGRAVCQSLRGSG